MMSDTGTVSAESGRIEAMNGVLADNWWAVALRGQGERWAWLLLGGLLGVLAAAITAN